MKMLQTWEVTRNRRKRKPRMTTMLHSLMMMTSQTSLLSVTMYTFTAKLSLHLSITMLSSPCVIIQWQIFRTLLMLIFISFGLRKVKLGLTAANRHYAAQRDKQWNIDIDGITGQAQ